MRLSAADPGTIPEGLPQLMLAEDPALMRFLFRDAAGLARVLAEEWRRPLALNTCHTMRQLWDGPHVAGLMNGFPASEYDARLEGSRDSYVAALQGRLGLSPQEALTWMERLYPAPRAGAFYILDLSVAPEAQGRGLGHLLLEAGRAQARSAGCTSLALDVAADQPAVGFYRQQGLVADVETYVPWLHRHHGIGRHLHMVQPLAA